MFMDGNWLGPRPLGRMPDSQAANRKQEAGSVCSSAGVPVTSRYPRIWTFALRPGHPLNSSKQKRIFPPPNLFVLPPAHRGGESNFCEFWFWSWPATPFLKGRSQDIRIADPIVNKMYQLYQRHSFFTLILSSKPFVLKQGCLQHDQ